MVVIDIQQRDRTFQSVLNSQFLLFPPNLLTFVDKFQQIALATSSAKQPEWHSGIFSFKNGKNQGSNLSSRWETRRYLLPSYRHKYSGRRVLLGPGRGEQRAPRHSPSLYCADIPWWNIWRCTEFTKLIKRKLAVNLDFYGFCDPYKNHCSFSIAIIFL